MTDKEKKAVADCLGEIIGVLCYQSDIPHHHKIDMCNKLDGVKNAFGIQDEEGQPT
jgi:hypothetical protein